MKQNFEIWNFPENLPILAAAIPSTFMYAAELSAPIKTIKKPNYKIFKLKSGEKPKLLQKLQVESGQKLENQEIRKMSYSKQRRIPV